MTSRARSTQAEHVILLSNDAPVLNRCAKEKAHLKHRLAKSTTACALMAQKSRTAAAREERSREARLQAQFTALLSATSGLVMPPFSLSSSTEGLTNAAKLPSSYAAEAANDRSKSAPTTCTDVALVSPLGMKPNSTVNAEGSAKSATYLPYALGFPDAYEWSGFKSVIHWASVAYDETFLTAYGPRRTREKAQARSIASAGDSAGAREAAPHRLMTAVACYLLNQILCADAALSELWQEKLRQPIFDAIFSSQPIALGQERSRAQRRGRLGDSAVANAIVNKTLGSASSHLTGTATHSSAVTVFPPRTNEYTTRDDFASLGLWTEEVALEQLEKASVCQRVRNLQSAMTRRQMAVHLFQQRAHQAELQAVMTVWRTYTQQRRTIRGALERYLVKRHHRHVEETIFLRWRRFTLRSKVEALQQRMRSIVENRECVARGHAAALRELQEQLARERRQHAHETFERDALQAQVLESHAMEIDALQLMLQMERSKAVQTGKWAKRWERAAKTFRPAKPCPAVPHPIWTLAGSLLSAEEELAAMVLKHSVDQRTLFRIPYSLILQARRLVEQLLLMWVNEIMKASPQASTWVTVEASMYTCNSQPRGILSSQKPSSSRKSLSRHSVTSGGALAPGKENLTCVFSIYTLMCLVRELRRCYTKAGLMAKTEDLGTPNGASVADYYKELTNVFAAQSCGGLYPPLLAHCPTSPLWFTPDGVFGGPASPLEGTTKQKRKQQTTFIWLLASLLVGHIRVMWMSPIGYMGPHPGMPMKGTATLPCKHEAEMMKLAHVSFPRMWGPLLGGSTAAPRGTSVVAPNTFLPKKRSAALTAASFSGRTAARASMVCNSIAEDVEDAAVVTTEMTLEALLRARVKATHESTAINSSSTSTGNDLLAAAEDSLSDIEAFLGMAPAQAQSLKGRADLTGTDNEDEDDDDGERWVNGLLHQLFEAKDAEAQQRRTKRLQGSEALKNGAEDEYAPSTAITPASELRANEEGEDGSKGNDAAAAAYTASNIYGDLSKSTITFTRDQLRLLRLLPGRSRVFDTLRPIAIPRPGSASVVEEFSEDNSNTATHASVAHLYSFLLNALDDTVARQQWSGLARVVTSLVVRFHVLEESEDATRRAAMLTPEDEECEELKSVSVSLQSPMERDGNSPLPFTAPLPPVAVGSAHSVAAAGKGGGGAAGMPSPSSGGRVAARLVPVAPAQRPQPPLFPPTTNGAQRRLPSVQSPLCVNSALDTGPISSQTAAEAGVPDSSAPKPHDVQVAGATSAQSSPTAASSIELVEELRRHGDYQTSCPPDSVSFSSPIH
ncbi:hypothetical protein, conserved [Leishmania tarentolae]|uniref:Uncharacterized protein n=1 Tax=Leishmania tarentolae TaxID=5689 RepID=A0A640KUQ4_LEITA|nr:hypothetical protein, conserved [Leishmania tarentolae]